MFADAINCTHNGTGGAGTITLASVTGYPQITDVFGTSGTMLVMYEIAEYTDSTLVTLSKYEAGYGSLVLSTNVLTRTTVLKTWTSGGSYARVSASALTFGNTAANVRIAIGAAHMNVRGNLMGNPASSFNGATIDGWMPFNTRLTYDTNTSTVTPSSGLKYYIPIEYNYARPITDVALRVGTGQAAKIARVGIYDMGAGGAPENLLTEFTSSSQISLATGSVFASVTMSTPFWIPPGFYWLLVQTDGTTATIGNNSLMGYGLTGSSSSRDIMYFTKTGTIGALPSTADTTGFTQVTRSSGGQVAVFCK